MIPSGFFRGLRMPVGTSASRPSNGLGLTRSCFRGKQMPCFFHMGRAENGVDGSCGFFIQKITAFPKEITRKPSKTFHFFAGISPCRGEVNKDAFFLA